MNPNEKITHKVSAEAAGRFERWMTEAEEVSQGQAIY